MGGKVADVGCGLGASTRLMAQAYPRSKFTGFDYHIESIELARAKAKDAGLRDRAQFEVAPAAAFPGSGYDLITMFDCLHDMGDPVGAARHVHQALDDWMIVEPAAATARSGSPSAIIWFSSDPLIVIDGTIIHGRWFIV